MTAPHVAVVGGGLAGLAAATALADAGSRVTLFEARPRLGGATYSFARSDITVDNGQHVFLRCCTAYRGFLERLGVAEQVSLQDRFDVTVLRPNGRPARLRRGTAPAPLHLAVALARYAPLPVAERVRAVRAGLALRRLDLADPRLDDVTFGAWLRSRGGRTDASRRLWDLFIVSALNAGPDEASLALAAMVLRTALLDAPDAADIGTPSAPLSRLHDDAARQALADANAQVRTRARVTAIQPIHGGFTVTVDGDAPAREPEANKVDGVVLAVPPDQASRLLPPAALPGSGRLTRLGASPIVNVHVIYDRRVTSLPFAAAVDSPVQWVFDRTRVAGVPEGQYLAVSVSAAHDDIDRTTADLRGRYLPALTRLFPAAGDARVVDFFVTRERRATFRQAPGSASLRPAHRTGLPGLVLAGAWTDTGWPDTMEGAVRSGIAAARLVREHVRTRSAAATAEPATGLAAGPATGPATGPAAGPATGPAAGPATGAAT